MREQEMEAWFDISCALQRDEEWIAVRKTKRKIQLIFLCFLCVSIFLSIFELPLISGITGAVAAALLAVVLIQSKYRAREYLPFVYAQGNPTPAIISQTNPLIVFALADLSREKTEPLYGLRWFRLHSLPGHRMEPGERIPCAAMYEDRKRPQQFLYYRIHPYCWATDHEETVQGWTDAIADAKWELLQNSMAAYGDLKEGEILELQADGTPVGRRAIRIERGKED